MCIKKKVQQPVEQTAPPPVEPPVEPSVATALPQSPEKKKSVDLADRSTYTAKSDLFPEEKTLKDKIHKTIPKVKKRNTDGKTIEEDAANVTGALNGLGHNAAPVQFKRLMESARAKPKPVGKIKKGKIFDIFPVNPCKIYILLTNQRKLFL
uniref:WH2 domain-containing protein n=1 Tax=Bursaphelenchus xylophilus TaxID=6326 RepID=A0A1I7SJC7_BURXY